PGAVVLAGAHRPRAEGREKLLPVLISGLYRTDPLEQLTLVGREPSPEHPSVQEHAADVPFTHEGADELFRARLGAEQRFMSEVRFVEHDHEEAVIRAPR